MTEQQREIRRLGAKLDPDLRAFIDAAIVPVLVKQYLALGNCENELAERDSDAAHSVSSTAAPGLREVRP